MYLRLIHFLSSKSMSVASYWELSLHNMLHAIPKCTTTVCILCLLTILCSGSPMMPGFGCCELARLSESGCSECSERARMFAGAIRTWLWTIHLHNSAGPCPLSLSGQRTTKISPSQMYGGIQCPMLTTDDWLCNCAATAFVLCSKSTRPQIRNCRISFRRWATLSLNGRASALSRSRIAITCVVWFVYGFYECVVVCLVWMFMCAYCCSGRKICSRRVCWALRIRALQMRVTQRV